MELVLALAALVLAIAAGALAWRAWAAAHRLALEMVQLRDRLARAERQRRDADARAEAAQESPVADAGAALAPRMARLEGRLRDALSSDLAGGGAPGADAPGGEVRERVREHLRVLGYERVAFLGVSEDRRILLEAERGGVTSKGHAEIGPDGGITFQALDTLRAFP